MQGMLQDLRHPLIFLRRAQGFASLAIVVLALGIAANTVVFSILDATLLRPLPYSDPSKLVVLHWKNQQGSTGDISAQAFFMLRVRAHSIQSITAIYPLDLGVNLAGPQRRYIKGLRVSRDFFQVLRRKPVVGRDFATADDQPGAPKTVVLSYGLWSLEFNRELGAMGQFLRINGEDYRIIGVMPEGFRSYPDAEVWMPLQLSEANADPGNDYRVIARLKDGLTRQQAQQEFNSLSEEYRLANEPEAVTGSKLLVLQELQDFLIGDVRKGLEILFGAVFFVLIIACTNLALLLRVRASSRRHEIATMAALGASRARLIQSVLSENLVLSILGGFVGLIGAKECIALLPLFLPADIPLTGDITLNQHVFLFTLGISLLTVIPIGLWPALRISIELNGVLRLAARGATHSREAVRTEQTLMRTQVALTLVLLSGATFLFRGYVALRTVPPGFDQQNVLVTQVSLAAGRYRTTAQTAQFFERISGELKAYADIEGVAIINGLPLEKGLNLPIAASQSPNKIEHAAEYRIVSSDYFRVMRIPVLQGRAFSDSDGAQTTLVAVINETLAHQWWPQSLAPGHFIEVRREYGNRFLDAPRLVIGVVGDVREVGLGRPAPPTMFVPLNQSPDNTMAFVNKLFLTSLVVRSKNTADLTQRVQNAVESADHDMPVAKMHPMSEVMSNSIARPRFYVLLTAAFSAFAVLLTSIGLYGLLSYRVVQRTREIAVRMAVGAQRREVVAMIVKEGVSVVFTSLLLGMAGGIFLKRVLATMMYNFTSSADVVVCAGILMLTVAALTSLLAASRAASIQPEIALRNE